LHLHLLLRDVDWLLDCLLLAGACVDPVNESTDASETGEDRQYDNKADPESPATALSGSFFPAGVGTARGSCAVNDSKKVLHPEILALGF
jgi:hypothetical protein